MNKRLLGGLDIDRFLRRHWQKKPLLMRRALVPPAAITRDALFGLARRDDVESRIVLRRGRQLQVHHGPFTKRALGALPRRNWTLLVQGVNHHLPAAHALRMKFAFIPYARLDDVMVSYAAPGGGVGPHFDSYDVFLLQGAGPRRWETSTQTDLALVDGAPLKILRDFRPDGRSLLEPGDMLYLPPRIAHNGVAVDHCITCSIGFRAPDSQELATRFLEFLQDTLALDGRYADPDLKFQRRPAHIGAPMLRQAAAMLARVRWNQNDVERFLGCHLTEPKANVIFDPPLRPLAPAAFARAAQRRGVHLALKSQMLYGNGAVFINGEEHALRGSAARTLQRLADRRALPHGIALAGTARELVHQWYRAGYLGLGEQPDIDDDAAR
jgi:50S ribosomal protein L16 3-hydroxylase